MSIVDTALSWARNIAEDDSHGYDQTNRWGVDYDCSSFVISAYKAAGIPLTCTYTGNMRGDMLRNGFVDVSASVILSTGAGLQAGDVLLNTAYHTALYAGNKQLIQASINELGTVTGGATGDQTGREILIRNYYNYPWDCVLRYADTDATDAVVEELSEVSTVKTVTAKLPEISRGDISAATAALQGALKYHGYDPTWVDGEFGLRTHNMLMGYQAANGLTADGICGVETWTSLLGKG